MERSEAIDVLRSHLAECRLCPRMCGVDRLRGELGFCQADTRLKVASHCLHRGEEPPISGVRGSGTIFFAHCNMSCVYCQNYPISQLRYGNYVETGQLAAMMLELQARGAHNLNLVTPTHFLPQILQGLLEARVRGLDLPVVYNSSGYERPEVIRLLAGVVDVYLADMRYSSEESAMRYSCAPQYPSFNRSAIREMYSQVGCLLCEQGIATRGLIIRHLVLPGLLAETDEILGFISNQIGTDVSVSLMSQYFPANRAPSYPELNRKLKPDEYDIALSLLHKHGLLEGWVQDPAPARIPVA